MNLFDKIADALKRREDLDLRMAEQEKERFFDKLCGRPATPEPTPETRPAASCRLRLSLAAGTGSCEHDEYVLDPAVSADYTVGRGVPTGSTEDSRRIFILDNESDPSLAKRNGSVSRVHAQIFFDKTEWLLVRTPGAGITSYSVSEDEGSHRLLAEGDGLTLRPGMRIFLGKEKVCLTIR